MQPAVAGRIAVFRNDLKLLMEFKWQKSWSLPLRERATR
jgi:hypothetical protein